MKEYVQTILKILDTILKDSIMENTHLYDANDKNNKITLNENISNYSFLTFKQILLRYTPKKTKHTIEIRYLNDEQLNNIRNKFQNVRYKYGDDLYIYIDIDKPEDINLLKQEILDIHKYLFLNEAVETFGCCSRYIECSDNKKCLCNDLIFRLGCQYKKNLEAGRIFYGKNKTIN